MTKCYTMNTYPEGITKRHNGVWDKLKLSLGHVAIGPCLAFGPITDTRIVLVEWRLWNV